MTLASNELHDNCRQFYFLKFEPILLQNSVPIWDINSLQLDLSNGNELISQIGSDFWDINQN